MINDCSMIVLYFFIWILDVGKIIPGASNRSFIIDHEA